MNIFGAFTFGSLIKTFLPGFVWLAAIVMLEADISQLLQNKPVLWGYAQSKDQAALVLAIPISILLGLLSNIIVFMGLNDRLVRTPVKQSNSALCALYDDMARRIREQCWNSLSNVNPELKPAFDANIDPELVLLNSIGVDKLAYVREQYWYHLEFQMNLLLSVGGIALALVLSAMLNVTSRESLIFLALGYGLAAAMTIRGLLTAARKNYARHLAKMATTMAAVLSAPEPQATTNSRVQ